MQEYPLYQHFNLCPTARYVGGVSKYLCECNRPSECEGVKAVQAEETQEHTTRLVKRSSDEHYPIDTFSLWGDPERAFHLACTDNHVTGKVKLTVWNEQEEAFMTQTIVGGDPDEFTIEDSLFMQRNW